jgi:hypothetical protein
MDETLQGFRKVETAYGKYGRRGFYPVFFDAA